jgi:hypothetical protein
MAAPSILALAVLAHILKDGERFDEPRGCGVQYP